MSLLHTTLTLVPESVFMVDNSMRCRRHPPYFRLWAPGAAPDIDRMIGLTLHFGLDLKGIRPW